MVNRVSSIYDGDLVLRTSGTPITATTSETGVSFPVRKIGAYKAVIQYNGKDYTTTDESYIFSVEVSNLVAGTYTAIATLPNIGGNGVTSGRLDIPLNGAIAEELDVDSAFVRITATLAGTTPSIDYDCYLTKE